jgi:hypothetical protein
MVRAVVLVAVVLGIGAVALNWHTMIRPVGPIDERGLLIEIVAVPPVVGALRIGLVLLSSYVAASVLGLAIEGRLLVKAGPGGAEAEPAGALAELERMNRELEDSVMELDDSLEEAWGAIRQLQEDWGANEHED